MQFAHLHDREDKNSDIEKQMSKYGPEEELGVVDYTCCLDALIPETLDRNAVEDGEESLGQ